MNTPEDFMQRAIDLAAENARTGRGGPFAAIVVKDAELIADGVNLVTATNDPTAHAEIVAIRKACAELKEFHLAGCELYASCEPCPMCLGAIYWARPDVIYFSGTHDEAAAAGFDDSFIYEQIRLPVEQRSIPMKRLLAAEAERPFEEWRRAARRIPY
jgi:tRNA(Arg) A34 adenosine deaminase TadA